MKDNTQIRYETIDKEVRRTFGMLVPQTGTVILYMGNMTISVFRAHQPDNLPVNPVGLAEVGASLDDHSTESGCPSRPHLATSSDHRHPS